LFNQNILKNLDLLKHSARNF